MDQPLVSIVTTAYKSRPDHLSAAIESALAQTWRRVEMLVADDSPDDALRVVVEKAGDSRVRYRHNWPALGVARNHWGCFREVSGEYIAILNHDDCFAPDFVERLVAPLERDSQLALAFCDHWVMDADGQRLVDATEATSTAWGRSSLSEGPHRPFFDLLATQTIPMAMGTVFRRRLLPPNLPDDAGPAYDLWLTYLLCRDGLGAYYVRDRLSSWRVHPSNLTARGGADWAYRSARCWQAVVDDGRLASVNALARRKAATASSWCARHAWAAGARVNCWNFGLQSIRLLPTWRGIVACCLPLVPRWRPS